MGAEEDIEAVKAWSYKWDLPANPVECQRLTPTGEHGGDKMDNIMEAPYVRDLGVTIMTKFKQSKQHSIETNKTREELLGPGQRNHSEYPRCSGYYTQLA